MAELNKFRFSVEQLKDLGLDQQSVVDFFGDSYIDVGLDMFELALYLAEQDENSASGVLVELRNQFGDEVADLIEGFVNGLRSAEDLGNITTEGDQGGMDGLAKSPQDEKPEKKPERSPEEIAAILTAMVEMFNRHVERGVTNEEQYQVSLASFVNGITFCYGYSVATVFRSMVSAKLPQEKTTLSVALPMCGGPGFAVVTVPSASESQPGRRIGGLS